LPTDAMDCTEQPIALNTATMKAWFASTLRTL
jgi:hypothetical protein